MADRTLYPIAMTVRPLYPIKSDSRLVSRSRAARRGAPPALCFATRFNQRGGAYVKVKTAFSTQS